MNYNSKSGNRIDPDEIWYWYNIIERCKAQGLSPKRFCLENNIDYGKFCGRRQKIESYSKSNPELYAKLIPIVREYLESGQRIQVFVEKYGVIENYISQAATHLRYLEVIEDMKSKQESSVEFIQVPSITSVLQPQCQVVAKRNDIEIIVMDGIRVIISPDIDSMRIVKLIDVLKDL